MTLSRDAIDGLVPAQILSPVSTPARAREFDQLVGQFRRLHADAAVTWWKTAKVLVAIHDRKLFLERYPNWWAFIRGELDITANYAANLMRVAREFREERAVRLGMTKCILLLHANKEDRPKLEARVKSGAIASTSDLRREVTRVNRHIPTGTNGRHKVQSQAYVRVKLGYDTVTSLKTVAADRGCDVESLVVEAVREFLSRQT